MPENLNISATEKVLVNIDNSCFNKLGVNDAVPFFVVISFFNI